MFSSVYISRVSIGVQGAILCNTKMTRYISSLHVAFHLVCVGIRVCHDTNPIIKATLQGPKRVSHEEMVMGI